MQGNQTRSKPRANARMLMWTNNSDVTSANLRPNVSSDSTVFAAAITSRLFARKRSVRCVVSTLPRESTARKSLSTRVRGSSEECVSCSPFSAALARAEPFCRCRDRSMFPPSGSGNHNNGTCAEARLGFAADLMVDGECGAVRRHTWDIVLLIPSTPLRLSQ